MKMQAAMLTKPGGKAINTDALAWQDSGDSLGCWIVADGRGDFGGERFAAKHAAKALLKLFSENPAISTALLPSIFEWAQREMILRQASEGADNTMRASAALLCTGGSTVLWGHIGDVRVYAFREGVLIAQTIDHSAPQGLVKAGELAPDEVRGHAERHHLLRSLGAPGLPRASILQERFKLKPGDLFLLCSNGFWEHVTEEEMLVDWCKSSHVQQWLDHMEMRLLRKAAPDKLDCYSAIALLVEA